MPVISALVPVYHSIICIVFGKWTLQPSTVGLGIGIRVAIVIDIDSDTDPDSDTESDPYH